MSFSYTSWWLRLPCKYVCIDERRLFVCIGDDDTIVMQNIAKITRVWFDTSHNFHIHYCKYWTFKEEKRMKNEEENKGNKCTHPNNAKSKQEHKNLHMLY